MTLQYCLALCDEIFYHFPLFFTELYVTQSFAIALSVTYSQIRQNFYNSEEEVKRLNFGPVRYKTLKSSLL